MSGRPKSPPSLRRCSSLPPDSHSTAHPHPDRDFPTAGITSRASGPAAATLWRMAEGDSAPRRAPKRTSRQKRRAAAGAARRRPAGRAPLRPVARLHPLGFLRGLLGPDFTGARQSLTALAVSSLTATAAGVLLAAATGTLERLPGLLVLVPAAIGMRGDIFGALGSRLATTIHAGTFRPTARRDTIVGQNVNCRGRADARDGRDARRDDEGAGPGLRAAEHHRYQPISSWCRSSGPSWHRSSCSLSRSGLATSSTRRGWDLDNVSAPLISAVGDVVTLPALFLASYLVGITALTPLIAVASVIGAVRRNGLGRGDQDWNNSGRSCASRYPF